MNVFRLRLFIKVINNFQLITYTSIIYKSKQTPYKFDIFESGYQINESIVEKRVFIIDSTKTTSWLIRFNWTYKNTDNRR